MISKSQREINISAYRQVQAGIQMVAGTLEYHVSKDPVIYASANPCDTIDILYHAVQKLEETISNIASEYDDEEIEDALQD